MSLQPRGSSSLDFMNKYNITADLTTGEGPLELSFCHKPGFLLIPISLQFNVGDL